MQNRKDLASIIADHDVHMWDRPHLHSILRDLHSKANKVLNSHRGTLLLNIMDNHVRERLRYDTPDIMKICKLATDTCYWPMFEVDHGKRKLTHEPKKEAAD